MSINICHLYRAVETRSGPNDGPVLKEVHSEVSDRSITRSVLHPQTKFTLTIAHIKVDIRPTVTLLESGRNLPVGHWLRQLSNSVPGLSGEHFVKMISH